MPLTKTGKKILKGFQKRYGKKGANVFYSTINKYPTRTKSWHGKIIRRKSK